MLLFFSHKIGSYSLECLYLLSCRQILPVLEEFQQQLSVAAPCQVGAAHAVVDRRCSRGAVLGPVHENGQDELTNHAHPVSVQRVFKISDFTHNQWSRLLTRKIKTVFLAPKLAIIRRVDAVQDFLKVYLTDYMDVPTVSMISAFVIAFTTKGMFWWDDHLGFMCTQDVSFPLFPFLLCTLLSAVFYVEHLGKREPLLRQSAAHCSVYLLCFRQCETVQSHVPVIVIVGDFPPSSQQPPGQTPPSSPGPSWSGTLPTKPKPTRDLPPPPAQHTCAPSSISGRPSNLDANSSPSGRFWDQIFCSLFHWHFCPVSDCYSRDSPFLVLEQRNFTGSSLFSAEQI